MTETDPVAERAALEWLALTDRGDPAASWAAAATLFRNALSAEQWAQALAAARGPLGALVSRKVSSATYASELPGVPDGEYVVLQFTTEFANKRAATETVTPMRDVDGEWHVCGYFIR